MSATSGDSLQDALGGRVIAGVGRRVRKGDRPIGGDHEHTAELPRVSGHLALDHAIGRNASNTSGNDLRAEEPAETCLCRSKRLVDLALGVDQEQNLLELVAALEVRGLLAASVADQHQARAGLLEAMTVAVQLHRLLAAEHSPVVAQQHQDRRLIDPEVTEPYRRAVVVAEHDVGKTGGLDVSGAGDQCSLA